MTKRAKVQRFEVREIPRALIKPATYNPRFIDKHAAKKLREHLKTVGLVEPLIWNETTGNLVGGHQRLDAMDELEGTRDYLVPVAVLHVTEKQEKELNVWLNNPATQGQWDFARLDQLFTEHGANPFEAGFEKLDLELMFSPESVEQMLTQFAPDEEATGVPGVPPDAVADAKKIAEIKENRRDWQAGARESLRQDHLLTIVWPDAAQAAAQIAQWQLPEFDVFVSAEKFIEIMRAFYGAPAPTEATP